MSKTVEVNQTASIKLLKRVQIRSKEGEVKYDSGLTPAHSWTREMIKQLISLLSDRNRTPSFNEIDGGTTDISVKSNWDTDWGVGSLNGGAGNDDQGIVIGYIADDLWPDDYEDQHLAGLITHGTGSGQLSYGAQQWNAAAVVGDNVDWVLYRDFTNSSGATVTINEVGIYAEVDYEDYACYARDILTDLDIPNGDVLRVTYVYRTAPADGLVKAFLQVVSCIQTWRSENPTIKRTDGVNDNVIGTSGWDNGGYPCDILGGGTSVDQGIVLGSGNTPVANTDYDLETPVEHGTGSGQLYYVEQKALELREIETGTPPKVTSSQWTILRYFINMSGGSITVREIGLKCQIDSGAYALIGRIVLDSAIVLADKGKLAVTLTLNTSFS